VGASSTLTRMPAYLGIDIGTQSAKGMLLDSTGRILAVRGVLRFVPGAVSCAVADRPLG
jgi:predicted NBD/HSP70 family sugar kinase